MWANINRVVYSSILRLSSCELNGVYAILGPDRAFRLVREGATKYMFSNFLVIIWSGQLPRIHPLHIGTGFSFKCVLFLWISEASLVRCVGQRRRSLGTGEQDCVVHLGNIINEKGKGFLNLFHGVSSLIANAVGRSQLLPRQSHSDPGYVAAGSERCGTWLVLECSWDRSA